MIHTANITSTSESVTLEAVQAARSRIAPYIRQTPVIQAIALKRPIPAVEHLWLKLECLQVTGAFKARGALNKLRSLSDEQIERGIVTASGGNHGLAVAYAGWIAGVPTTIYLGENTPPIKAERLQQWGAQVIIEGADWDEANQAALALAERQGIAYFHPFADPFVIAGQGTISLEVLEAVPEIDTLVVAIGGGGLISGVSTAAKALKPSIKIVGVEPVGAPTLQTSVQSGKVTELTEITSIANTLAPRKTEEINLQLVSQYVDEIVLVSDDEMHEAARWLWFEMGVAAELSGSASVAALLGGHYRPAPGEKVCALVCGAGTDGMS